MNPAALLANNCRSLLKSRLLNRFENPNSTGYEELIDQEEEENWYAEHGYDAPHIKEDIAEARKNRKGYIE